MQDGFIRIHKILKESDLNEEHQEKIFATFLTMSQQDVNSIVNIIEKDKSIINKLDKILETHLNDKI